MPKKIDKTDEEWRAQLTPEEYHVTREGGTEGAFTGAYCDTKDAGTYRCVACGAELFRSDAKYDSESGWPSFYRSCSRDNVGEREDNKLFMRRTEVFCTACDAHLGHLFPDGPQPTGNRYCINSAALNLEKDAE